MESHTRSAIGRRCFISESDLNSKKSTILEIRVCEIGQNEVNIAISAKILAVYNAQEPSARPHAIVATCVIWSAGLIAKHPSGTRIRRAAVKSVQSAWTEPAFSGRGKVHAPDPEPDTDRYN